MLEELRLPLRHDTPPAVPDCLTRRTRVTTRGSTVIVCTGGRNEVAWTYLGGLLLLTFVGTGAYFATREGVDSTLVGGGLLLSISIIAYLIDQSLHACTRHYELSPDRLHIRSRGLCGFARCSFDAATLRYAYAETEDLDGGHTSLAIGVNGYSGPIIFHEPDPETRDCLAEAIRVFYGVPEFPESLPALR